MKKVGIVGGIGPASTLDYYREIINGYRAKSQNDEYPKIVIDSVNMTEMLGYLNDKQWDFLVKLLLNSISNLEKAGADFAVIASNTPHIVFNEVQRLTTMPLISIVNETCKKAKRIGCKRAAVLGTAFTMGSGLYINAFKEYGIEAFTPDRQGQLDVNNIIFPNLENGIIIPQDREKMIGIANKLIKETDSDALVLGCTELPLIIKENDIETTLLNTTQIHVDSIVDMLLK